VDLTYLLKWLGATLGVLGMIYLLYFLAGKKIAKKGRDLEIVEALPLGNRLIIYLVRVKDRILAVGVSPAGMHVLTQFDPGDTEASDGFDVESEEMAGDGER
jgi:flagellar biogenesis protein FliO